MYNDTYTDNHKVYLYFMEEDKASDVYLYTTLTIIINGINVDYIITEKFVYSWKTICERELEYTNSIKDLYKGIEYYSELCEFII